MTDSAIMSGRMNVNPDDFGASAVSIGNNLKREDTEQSVLTDNSFGPTNSNSFIVVLVQGDEINNGLHWSGYWFN